MVKDPGQSQIIAYVEKGLNLVPTVLGTVPTLNSCTKCVGSPGIIHDRTTDCQPSFMGMDARMTSQLNVTLILKLRGPFICLAYYLTCYPWMFVLPGTGRFPVDWCRN